MALQLMTVELDGQDGPYVDGYEHPMDKVGASEALLASALPGNIVSWAAPGRDQVSDSPVTDRDAADDGRRLWTARAASVTRARAENVLSGLARWVATGQAVDGLAGSLPAALTDYSLGFVWRNNSVGTHRVIFGVGTNSSDHAIIYHNSAGNGLNIQHTAGNTVQTGDIGLAQDEWIAGLVSYRDNDGAIEVFVNGTTPVFQGTLGVSPPASTDAYFLTGPNDFLPAHGELAIGLVWDTPLHTQPGALADAMSALINISEL